MIVHVVREGGRIERAPAEREKREIRREIVYARRGLRSHGLVWRLVSSLVGQRWRLEVGGIVAEVHTADRRNLMAFCHVEVGGELVPARHPQEEMAGFGGLNVVFLRATQHVLALLDEHAADAEKRLSESA